MDIIILLRQCKACGRGVNLPPVKTLIFNSPIIRLSDPKP